MRKRISLILILITLVLPGIIFAALAPSCEDYCIDPEAYDGPPAGQVCICNPLETEEFGVIIDNFIDFLFKIAIPLVPLMIIYAGFLFVTAGGSIVQIDKAKRVAVGTVIGLAIILLSKGILTIIKQLLEIGGG